MYMTGTEMKEHYGSSERDSGETEKDLWDRKLEESKQVVKGEYNENGKDTSLYESIKKHGVKEPVEILHDRVWDGHHRVASSAHANPQALIPLEHVDR
jgi:hypothetical protein